MAADDRSMPLRSDRVEIVGKPDRRRPLGKSSNSRQSRMAARTSSSYPQGRDTSNMKFARVIGVDVSKAKLDLADWPESMAQTFENDPVGHQKLLETLPEQASCLVVLEATGGYEKRSSWNSSIEAISCRSSTHDKFAISPKHSGSSPRPTASTLASLLDLVSKFDRESLRGPQKAGRTRPVDHPSSPARRLVDGRTQRLPAEAGRFGR